ncbi:MAG: oligosaccharide flippase family protein [Candidatus Aenigmarchaeota archaeon]|nr:oligosaccharide flippase family protein [Candidatus Aenigmarchaeota archaeon]
MKPEKKALENTFFISLSWLITTFVGFIFWLIAGKFLTQDEYGTALTSVTLGFFIISVITFGIPSALSKLIPEYLSEKKKVKITQLVSTATLMIIITSAVTMFVFLIFKQKIMSLIKVSENIYYLIIAYIFIGSVSTTFYTITYGFQHIRKYFIVGAIASIIKVLIALLILFLGFKHYGPITGVLLSSIFTIVACYPRGLLKLKIFKIDLDLFKYAITGFIGAMVLSMLSNFQYTIVTILKSNFNTGIFGVAMMISSVIGAIPSILNTSIYPIVSGTFKTKSKKYIPILLNNTVRYSILIAIPLIIIFSILSEFIVVTFSSYKFLDSAKLIPILSLATLFLNLSNIFTNTLYAIRRPRIYIKILLSIASLFLLLTIPLTIYYGELGMAIGYLIVSTIFMFTSFYNIKRFIRVEVNVFDILKILAASLSFITLYLLKPKSITLITLSIALSFFAYFLILWFLKFFTKKDYMVMRELISKIKILIQK